MNLNAPQRQSDRLSIRLIRRDDAAAIYNLYAHSDVCRYYDLLPFTDPDQAREQVEKWCANFERGQQIRYAICEDSEVIGSCGLYSIYRHQNRANLGYDLLPSKWDQGIMTEALGLFLQLCFKEWNLHRIQALVLPENIASQKLLAKLGFNCEGILKDYEMWPVRGYVDLQLFSLINNQ